MEQFYVGYGHASIADCGSTTIFIEGISILGDKAIQDWPLYSGQETSTRYVDMSQQPIIDPIATDQSRAVFQNWMKFYLESLPIMEEFLAGKYPKKEADDEIVYKKAIKARAFDILRGFLPAGITTQLSWHTKGKRTCVEAQWEIRIIAWQIAKYIKDTIPAFKEWAEPQCITYGKCPEVKDCRYYKKAAPK